MHATLHSVLGRRPPVASALWLTGLLLLGATVVLYLLILLGYAPGVDITLVDHGLGLILALGQAVLLTCGVLIISRWPGHLMGWLFCGAGLVNLVQNLGFAYESFAGTRDLPLLSWVLWLAAVPEPAGFLVLLLLVSFLFPNGQLVSRRWLPLLVVGLAGIVGNMVRTALAEPLVGIDPSQENANPAYSDLLAEVLTGLEPLMLGAVSIALLGGLLSMVVRYRRARGVERLQLRWLLWMLGLVVTCFLVFLFGEGTGLMTAGEGLNLPELVLAATFLVGVTFGVPTVLGLSILRYRLYDIDLIINRTLVYGALTLGLGATYAGSVVVFRQVLDPLTGNSDVAIAGSTLIVAVLFQPLRRRIQRIVDRRFYRTKYDAARIVQDYSTTVRQEVKLDQLLAGLSAVVTESLQPASVSVWLRKRP